MTDSESNPTSPLGDRWFRACVAASIPPTSPSNAFYIGGGVYPSSYLLPWTQNRGAEWGRSHLYPTFSPSWSSSFFHHFFNTRLCWFWLHFGPQLGAKMAPKSIPKVIFSSSEPGSSDFLIFATPSMVFNGFWGPRPPKTLPKCNQIASEISSKSHSKFLWFCMLFLLIFVQFWGPSWTPFSSKIAQNEAIELGTTTLFFIFASFRYFGVPPGPDLVDLGSIFGWFGHRFEWISAPTSKHETATTKHNTAQHNATQ